MASICPPSFPSPLTDTNTNPNPHKSNFTTSRLTSSKLTKRSSQSRVFDSTLCCRCINNPIDAAENSNSNSNASWPWDFGMQETFRNAIKRFDDYLSSFKGQNVKGNVAVVEEWDWERWKKHFADVDEQERIVSVLKSQLASAIQTEDYEDAARIKVAIAAATINDTVGRVMSHLQISVEEERYGDAARVRDNAGAGLVGWWAGIAEDGSDPYGRIINIRAEYGRYIARSYSPRQLATASDGAPVFEVYLTNSKRGDYNQQAVYLKRKGTPLDLYPMPLKSSGSTRDPGSRDARDSKSKLFERSLEDAEDNEDRDDDSGFDNALRDMIPGVKVKVVKVTTPEKVDRDLISKVIEQIIDDEEDEKDYDIENMETEDEIKNENDEEHNDIELDASSGLGEDNEQNQVAVELLVGDSFIQKMSRGTQRKDLLRVPARLEKKDRLSFTFTVEEDANDNISGSEGQPSQNKRAKLLGQGNIDHVMLDLVKSVGKGKIPMKVLKDVGDLISLTLSQARNRQPLSGSTTFNRIDMTSSSDPLNGVYIGAHGLYTSEVIHLKRRFGQWKEDATTKKPSKIEFYEYVEAVKLTGDPYVPAGQVAFRAKVGKGYQLPHKGIIPEEFGVIARYKGQGRLSEPGFKNPRWVDGELVILDGKYIKGGPVVGFVYWAPEYHFLVFFNRLRLQG